MKKINSIKRPIEDNMGISVIVCCYNSNPVQTIQTLTSIEKQKNLSFDIILADDGSIKRYLDIILHWIHQHGFTNISIVQNKKNKGTVRNFYSAVSLCKYPYIKIISPGDFLFDEFTLQKYLNCFIEKKATIVTGKAIFYTSDYKIIPCLSIPYSKVQNHYLDLRKTVLFGSLYLGAALAYRKEFLEKSLPILISEIGVVYLEDKPLVDICILNNLKFTYLPENVIWYEYGNGISTSLQPNSKLKKDDEAYFHWLGTRDNKFAKKGSKIYFSNSSERKKILYKFLYTLFHPIYFLFTIINKLSRLSKKERNYETDITKMNRMINLD